MVSLTVCVTGCDDGRFGRDCAELCECHGALCDPTTGRCLCLSIWKDRRTLRERCTNTHTPYTSYANSHKPCFKLSNLHLLSQFVTAGFMVQAVLSSVSVHTEASVTSAQVTARVLSPGWDPPVRKVRVCSVWAYKIVPRS